MCYYIFLPDLRNARLISYCNALYMAIHFKSSDDKQDTDKDGAIGFHELKVALRALGFDLKKAEVLKILRDYDRQGSGQMLFDDFSKVGELVDLFF